MQQYLSTPKDDSDGPLFTIVRDTPFKNIFSDPASITDEDLAITGVGGLQAMLFYGPDTTVSIQTSAGDTIPTFNASTNGPLVKTVEFISNKDILSQNLPVFMIAGTNDAEEFVANQLSAIADKYKGQLPHFSTTYTNVRMVMMKGNADLPDDILTVSNTAMINTIHRTATFIPYIYIQPGQNTVYSVRYAIF